MVHTYLAYLGTGHSDGAQLGGTGFRVPFAPGLRLCGTPCQHHVDLYDGCGTSVKATRTLDCFAKQPCRGMDRDLRDTFRGMYP